MVFLTNECSMSVGTITAGGNTQTRLAVEKIELFALSGSGDAKTFGTRPDAQVLAPTLAVITNHLAKLSLPNILYIYLLLASMSPSSN